MDDRIGKVLLIYHDEKPTVYARIEAIEPDVKKGWYQVHLLLLTLPPQSITWILRDAYINGTPFTMGGRPVRMEDIPRMAPETTHEEKVQGPEEVASGKSGKVLPFRKGS